MLGVDRPALLCSALPCSLVVAPSHPHPRKGVVSSPENSTRDVCRLPTLLQHTTYLRPPTPGGSPLDFSILDFLSLFLSLSDSIPISIHQPISPHSFDNRRDTNIYRQTLVGPTSHPTGPTTTVLNSPSRIIRLVRDENLWPPPPRPELTAEALSMVISPALVSMTRLGGILST